jgi:hypothetical protein
MKPLFLFSLLLLLATAARAQSSPADIFRRVQRSSGDSLDAGLCATYVAAAQREIAQGRLHLDYFSLPATSSNNSTFWQIMALQYGVTPAAANDGDFIPTETECYNACMTEAIEAKFGRGILQRVAARTDSLVRIGRGFREAHPVGLKTAHDLFKQQFAYRADFRQNHRLRLGISFTVDSRGQAGNLRLEQCSRCIGPALDFTPLPSTHRYYAEVRRILRSRRWQAATLEARPVPTTVYVRLGYASL